jgi:hypothetical protein
MMYIQKEFQTIEVYFTLINVDFNCRFLFLIFSRSQFHHVYNQK